jgi:hypothetical protein
MGIHACAPKGTDCPALALGGSDARESDPTRPRPADGSRANRKLRGPEVRFGDMASGLPEPRLW